MPEKPNTSPMLSRSPTIALLALALLLTPACWFDSNSAQFTLTGQPTTDADCFARTFPLTAEFAAARDSQKTISLVFQSETTDFLYNNGVFIEIYKPDQIHNNLTRPVPISAPETIDAMIGAKITLFGSCPDILNSFYLDGEVVFSTLERGKNAHIIGTITNARIRNSRTHEVVADGFSGSWNLTARPGQPFQQFYALP